MQAALEQLRTLSESLNTSPLPEPTVPTEADLSHLPAGALNQAYQLSEAGYPLPEVLTPANIQKAFDQAHLLDKIAKKDPLL